MKKEESENKLYTAVLRGVDGRKPLSRSDWDEAYDEGTVYCGFFVEDKIQGRIATIRTEEDNFAMQRVIEKLKGKGR